MLRFPLGASATPLGDIPADACTLDEMRDSSGENPDCCRLCLVELGDDIVDGLKVAGVWMRGLLVLSDDAPSSTPLAVPRMAGEGIACTMGEKLTEGARPARGGRVMRSRFNSTGSSRSVESVVPPVVGSVSASGSSLIPFMIGVTGPGGAPARLGSPRSSGGGTLRVEEWCLWWWRCFPSALYENPAPNPEPSVSRGLTPIAP